MPTTAELTIENRVARITFTNPDGLNILDATCRESLRKALDQVAADRSLRLLVLAATGKVFLAGADLKELGKLDGPAALAYAEAGQAIANRIEDLEIPALAVIQGACAGGGCEMALACDLRIAGEGARIGLPETTLGVMPGWGGSVRAARDLGAARAKQVIFSGTLYPAREAQTLGLVHRVATDAELAGAASAWIAELLTRGPQGLSRAKAVLNSHTGADRAAQLAVEARAFAECFASGQAVIGVAAFLAKRPPEWP